MLCIVTICTYISYCAFVTLYLYIGTLRTMNASTWKKAADIVAKTTSVTPQASATATTELHNLQSLQLSTLSIDDSGPLQVTYEPQQPIATSTPQATDNSEIPTEAYHQILPGMTSRLYPTLVADSSLEVHMSDQQDTLQMQLSTEVNKYLQEAAAKQEMDVNYFDRDQQARQKLQQKAKIRSRAYIQLGEDTLKTVHRTFQPGVPVILHLPALTDGSLSSKETTTPTLFVIQEGLNCLEMTD